MNVEQLRTLLIDYPLDMVVAVDGYEGGITEQIRMTEVDVVCDVNTEGYYGEHEEASDYQVELHPDAERKTVLLLSRHSG